MHDGYTNKHAINKTNILDILAGLGELNQVYNSEIINEECFVLPRLVVWHGQVLGQSSLARDWMRW